MNLEHSQTRREPFVDTFGNLRVAEPVRLIGASFSGTQLDTERWISTVQSTGYCTLKDGVVTLGTGNDATGRAVLQSKRMARFITGSCNCFISGVMLVQKHSNNIRRWGCFDENNGYYFYATDSKMMVGTRKSGVDTLVALEPNADFPEFNQFHMYEICYAADAALFFIDRKLVRSVGSTRGLLASTLHFKMRFETIDHGAPPNSTLEIRSGAINRLGAVHGEDKYHTFQANKTVTLKRGPGRLSKIIVGATGANKNSIELYDSETIDPVSRFLILDSSQLRGVLTFDLNFEKGLTYKTTSDPGSVIILWD